MSAGCSRSSLRCSCGLVLPGDERSRRARRGSPSAAGACSGCSWTRPFDQPVLAQERRDRRRARPARARAPRADRVGWSSTGLGHGTVSESVKAIGAQRYSPTRQRFYRQAPPMQASAPGMIADLRGCEPGRARVALVEARVRRHRREPRRLLRRELRRRHAEVALRRGLGAEHAVAPFDHVEVELENPPLRQHRLEHQRDHRLLRLAHSSCAPATGTGSSRAAA